MSTLEVLKEARESVVYELGDTENDDNILVLTRRLARLDAEISSLESQKKVRGWAIKGPDGHVYMASCAEWQHKAWTRMIGAHITKTREFWQKEGYRAVEVEITEVNAAPQEHSSGGRAPGMTVRRDGLQVPEAAGSIPASPAGAAPNERSEP